MRISEIFHSIQGEGVDCGLPTVFVRTTGCHLRCVWCDSAYAFHGGTTMSVDEVVDHVAKWPTKRVCFTGGEPLLQKDADELLRRLLDADYRVLIETSGSLELASYARMEPADQLVLSVDVKCPGSAMAEHNKLDELAHLRPHDQVKFVVKDEVDYRYAADVIQEHPVPCRVVLQPVWGDTDPAWLTQRVLDDGLDVQVSLQMHKIIWGDVPGR